MIAQATAGFVRATAGESLLGGAFALFLDVDGTLLDLAQRPEAVITPAGLVTSLAAAERRLQGALALVSGRPMEDLDRLFAPLRLRGSGVHGAELRLDSGGVVATPAEASEMPASLWDGLTRLTGTFPGTLIENKRFSYAVHFRLAPWSEAPLRAAIAALVADEPAGSIEILEAHFALELKRPGLDKGRAIAAFLASPPFSGRTPIFVGDDTTDQSGFATVAAHGGFAYAVGERRPGAIGVFEGPGEVREWLFGFAGSEAA